MCQWWRNDTCAPSVVDFLEVPSILVDLKIFLREHRTERTKPLLGDGLERAKVHNSMGVVWIGVRPWSNGVEACCDRSNRGINERLHFVLQVDRGETRLIA